VLLVLPARAVVTEQARSVVVTTNEMRATNKAVVTLRKLYPEIPIYARASDAAHAKRLQKTLDVVATVPILPEDSVLLSLPFGGRVLRNMGVSPEEVDMLMEDMRKKVMPINRSWSLAPRHACQSVTRIPSAAHTAKGGGRTRCQKSGGSPVNTRGCCRCSLVRLSLMAACLLLPCVCRRWRRTSGWRRTRTRRRS
jgi:hypothetical protein